MVVSVSSPTDPAIKPTANNTASPHARERTMVTITTRAVPSTTTDYIHSNIMFYKGAWKLKLKYKDIVFG